MNTIKSKTERLYFNAEFINNTGTLQDARYDAQLIYPLLDKPNEYDICINRFRIDLAGIPLNLGNKNIPFNQWEVSLGFYDSNTWVYFNAFVPQFQPKQITYNYLYNITTSEIQKLDADFNIVESTPISGGAVNGSTFDTVYNGTYYAWENDTTINCYSLENNTLLYTFTAPTDNIYTAICTNKSNGDLFIALFNQSAGSNGIVQFQRTSQNTWTQTTFYSTTSSGTNTTTFMAYADGHLATVFDPDDGTNYATLYIEGNGTQVQSFQIGEANCSVTSNNGNVYYALYNQNTIIQYNIINNLLVQQNVLVTSLNSSVQPFIGFDASNNVLIDGNLGGTQYSAYSPNLSFLYYFDSVNQPVTIFPSTLTYNITTNNPIANPVYTYQKYLDQINSALTTAFNNIVSEYGSLYVPTQAPKIIYNGTDKLFQMIVEGAYTQSNNFLIDFNYGLNQLFLFNNTIDENNSGFYSIQVLNNYTNAIVGNGSITTPQFLYVEQQASTTYQFWNLARIIIATSKLGVNGDSEGTSGNNQILAITDVTPDTTSLNPNSILIYSPFVLRFYQMYQTTPLTRLDLNLQIGDKAGNVYPLQLQGNGGYASVKLEWRRTSSGSG